MRHTFKYICMVLTAFLASSCLNTEDFWQEEEPAVEYGNVELSFNGTTRATTTTISPEEAKNFLITVTQGDRILRGPQTLATMNLRFPVGQGYQVFAESCSEYDAEFGNDQWGQKRFTGISEEFGVNKGETTKASVGMSVSNAALCMVIGPSLVNYFKTSCTISVTDGDRTLEWNYDIAGKDENGVVTDGKIAYFNTDETGYCTLHYTIKASSEGNITDMDGTLTLTRAKMSRLRLELESGNYTFDVSVNQDDLYIDDNLSVTPDDVTSDDGATDAVGGNDEFGTDNSEPDYDQYN
ncbi:MAG: DUF4493 domain-containing protein [Bacteroidaceae bacterium]|nr:DUF4493 domain-containing protein [Bacteroidaceae bacterium]